MKTKRKHKSDAFEAVHSAVEGMHRSGTVDKDKMRDFEALCLTAPASIEPQRLKQLRERNSDGEA